MLLSCSQGNFRADESLEVCIGGATTVHRPNVHFEGYERSESLFLIGSEDET